MSATQIAGAVLLSLGLIAGLWQLVASLHRRYVRRQIQDEMRRDHARALTLQKLAEWQQPNPYLRDVSRGSDPKVLR